MSELQWTPQEYQLVDFGEGRKLERFGKMLLDRPSPAALGMRKQALSLWRDADVVLSDSDEQCAFDLQWTTRCGPLVFQLKLTPFGHVGVFPEQVDNWRWLTEETQAIADGRTLSALNLFAYTGGMTLALAASGVHVIHCDASAPAVAWARQNAAASGLDERPIRWITEDARKFVSRELRRGNHYDFVIMDPPSYGHGPSGRRWEIARDLPQLLEESLQLLNQNECSRLLVTGHSSVPSDSDIAAFIHKLSPLARLQQYRLTLEDGAMRHLDAGFCIRARWSSK
ncbi:MAG: class I SAM-dependent methyltransferase [Pirellulaceae bacterium]